MKKYIPYIVVLLIGISFGWLVFSGNSGEVSNHNHKEAKQPKTMWTCSMHPQIMQPEPGDCPICGMDLIPAEAGAEGLSPNQFKLTKNALALANVQTTVIGNLVDSDNTLTVSGKVAENEKSNTVQVSYFAGRIERLHINFTGEKIRKGQLLALVYSPELVKAQQELLTAASIKKSQPDLYKAVRNKLRLWKLSNNQINQIESTGKVKENFPVYATVSGTVLEKLVEQGDYVEQGQALLKVANLSSVWANFDVYENQISNFKEGQNITITTNTYPNEKFTAKISFINPVMNPQTRTVTIRAELKNSEDKFKPQMFVSGSVDVNNTQLKKLITIPASSVLWTGKRSVVYVKPDKNNSVFEMREVVLGGKIDDYYQVKKGLISGEEIVTNGVFTIDASAQLHGKKSMMNHTKEINESLNTSKEFKQQLQKVYESYIELKDALVKDNADEAVEKAIRLQSNLELINGDYLVQKTAQQEWQQIKTILQTTNSKIQATKDISEQRKYFKFLSDSFIKAVQVFGINEVTYKQYCPMANSDKGAYWLSKEEKILNPYFGDIMLQCGEVKEKIVNN